jgi:uncharacterized protein (DUF433 family)
MEQATPRFARRDPDTIGKIAIDSNVLVGKPRIAGTRISVELVLEEMSAGTSVEDLLAAYPHLTRQDIQAALSYALQSIRHEEVRPIPEAAG